jgi:transglutaminase-like putative cysteine protease
MKLKAGCELVMSAPQPVALVAMLRPRSGVAQWVMSERYELDPFVHAVEYPDGFGNLCQRFNAPAGKFRILTEVVIEVTDSITVAYGAAPTPCDELPDYALQFLLPSRYCPSDTLDQLAHEITKHASPGYDQVEAIRAWIRQHIAYRYGVSNASTSATDTLRDKAGVCRDFSHIGLSLCRALRIPARMAVGYLYQLDPMDLHAWFEAFIDGRWYTFDATQKEAKGGRITIAYGRDAADVALVTNFGALTTDSTRVWVDKL